MLLTAKTVAPAGVTFPLGRELVEAACASGSATIMAPPGALLPEALAEAVRARCGEPLWVTLGPEDSDPGVLLYSLVRAAQRLVPTIGAPVDALLADQGALTDLWPPLFRALADDLLQQLPAGCVLVFEHADQLDAAGATLSLLNTYLLRSLAGKHVWMLISRHEPPRVGMPPETLRINAAGLRLNNNETGGLAAAIGCRLPTTILRRLNALVGGRADCLYSFFRMADRLGAPSAATIIEHSDNAEQALVRIARAVYGMAGPADHTALDVSRRLGYTHPDLVDSGTPDQVWLLPLADGWQRLRDVWQTILPRVVRPGEHASTATLHCIAEALVGRDALIPAIELYQELGAFNQAAAVINTALDRMMRLGQWRTLERWLDRTPAAVLQEWPWLTYARGEIAAAQHNFSLAQRSFASATNGFSLDRNAAGACQSLLAEGTVMAWQGQVQAAVERTQAALTHAEGAALPWHLGWATWQLVELALDNSSLAGAMVHLERALQAATDAEEHPLAALLGEVEALLSQRRTLNERREQHRQAYFALEQAEQTLHEQARRLLTTPHSLAVATLAQRPWTAMPLLLKLPAPSLTPLEADKRPGFWQELLRTLGLQRPQPPQPPDPPPPPALPITLFSLDNAPPPAPRSTTPLVEQVAAPEPQPTLIAHLLGPFRISLNDEPIVNWPSGRGRALLKYLLLHHERPTPRDVLMELLWPEIAPDDARNRLNVAMHGLRQAFRSITDRKIVLFQREDATYRLNPELAIWIDVIEFERSVAAGRRCESANLFAEAVVAYEQAANLYQGDFLADDPYEDWPMLRREQLRLAYLDTLERLGQIYFSQGQYGACAALCQQILARDNCREDAHCRLMRCYSRQGQHHLALRQYQACVKALNDELGVEPLPATVRLADMIRRHEFV